LASIVPQAAPLHAVPETLQVTAVFVVFVTVAVNWRVAPRRTEAVEGETLTVTGGGGPGFGELLPPPPQPNAAMARVRARQREVW